MKFQLRDSGLYCYSSDEWQRVGGWIEVVARTRLSTKTHGHGALLQWRNMDNVLLREVIYARNLNGDHARQIRELLVDTGYPLEPGSVSWTRLQRYLLDEMAKAPPATTVDRTGWHGPVFATSGWTAGHADEQYYLVGQLSTSPLLQVAASVCGAPTFVRSWISTANGLAAVSSEHNDMLLALDEIGLARPEDVDTTVYHIMNGASKLRANITGDLAPQTHWRTLALSTGEVWLSEVFQQMGKSVKAGQANRLVEIPTFGRFGAFDELHGFKSPQDLVDALKSNTRHYHGTLFRQWLECLTEDTDGDLPEYIQREVARIAEHWTTPQMASQVIRVIKRFALVTAALCLACRNYLLPWTETDSFRAVEQAVSAWLRSRGHVFNSEEYQLLSRLRDAVYSWNYRLIKMERGDYGNMAGLKRDVDGERQWLIPKHTFLKELGLPTRYMREVETLIQKGLLETNEQSRGTMKIKLRNRYERFFAVWPDRVRAYWAEIPDGDGLSQFPSIPTDDSEVAEDE